MIPDQYLRARRALLDALEALGAHRKSVILVGAQAIYLHTGSAPVGLAEFTTDADLVIDSRELGDAPLVEAAMAAGGFVHPADRNPGVWLSRDSVQVDLMVPAAFAGGRRRGAAVPPHHRNSMRKSAGLEAALVDRAQMEIRALDPEDPRLFRVMVAGPAALLVAKLHKLHERIGEARAVENKDAHDIYRILLAVSTERLAEQTTHLLANEVSAGVTEDACRFLAELFSGGPNAAGSTMAGEAELGLGAPSLVALSVSLLAADLEGALASR